MGSTVTSKLRTRTSVQRGLGATLATLLTACHRFGDDALAHMHPRHASALKPSRQVNTVARITVPLPACD